MGSSQSNAGIEPIRPPFMATKTRMACNHNWNRRGDNAKYKEKK